MHFKLKTKVGGHSETDSKGKVINYLAKDGKIIESDNDLCAMFPEKFEKVEIPTAPVTAIKPKKVKAAAPKEDPKEPVSLGKDVTEKFPSAIEEDLKVFTAKGLGYFVTEADEDTVALNDTKLKKVDVDNFISEYLEE